MGRAQLVHLVPMCYCWPGPVGARTWMKPLTSRAARGISGCSMLFQAAPGCCDGWAVCAPRALPNRGAENPWRVYD